eukprot:10358135-Lingulodinium_polyedra.AAC.1
MVMGMCCATAASKRAKEKKRRTFPSRTLASSPAERPGRPMGRASERSGGGPGGLSRAREKDEHGVPAWMAHTR